MFLRAPPRQCWAPTRLLRRRASSRRGGTVELDRSGVRGLLKLVHPDLHRERGAQVVTDNQRSLQELNSFLDAAETLVAGGEGARGPLAPRIAPEYAFRFHFEDRGALRAEDAQFRSPPHLVGAGVEWAGEGRRQQLRDFAHRVLRDLLARLGLHADASRLAEHTQSTGASGADEAGMMSAMADTVMGGPGAHDDPAPGDGAPGGSGPASGDEAHTARESTRRRMRRRMRGLEGDFEDFTAASRQAYAGGHFGANLRAQMAQGTVGHDLLHHHSQPGFVERTQSAREARRRVVAALFDSHRVRLAAGLPPDVKHRAAQRVGAALVRRFLDARLDQPDLWSDTVLLVGREWRVHDDGAVEVPYDADEAALGAQVGAMVARLAAARNTARPSADGSDVDAWKQDQAVRDRLSQFDAARGRERGARPEQSHGHGRARARGARPGL